METCLKDYREPGLPFQHEAGEGQRAEAERPIYSDLGRCLLARQVLISYSSLSSLLSLSRPYTFNLEAYPGVLKSDIRTNTKVFKAHGFQLMGRTGFQQCVHNKV